MFQVSIVLACVVIGFLVDGSAGDVAPTGRVRAPTADATAPGSIETEATFTCIGIKWWIEGDEDLDCSVAVQYRESRDFGDRNAAQPLLRVEPGTFNDYNVDPVNLLAGSIFELQEDRTYDLLLDLFDPDGGAGVETLEVRTRTVPGTPADARIRFVIPGDGGGSGTKEDPFRGLRTANSAAEPGDFFILRAGTYFDSIAFTTSGTEDQPIVYLAEERDAIVLDGANQVPHLISYPGTEHVHLENLTIARPREWAG
jgi:hypothetical protein